MNAQRARSTTANGSTRPGASMACRDGGNGEGRYVRGEGTGRKRRKVHGERNKALMHVYRCHKRPFRSPSWSDLLRCPTTRPNATRVCRYYGDFDYVQDAKTRRAKRPRAGNLAPAKRRSAPKHPSPRKHPPNARHDRRHTDRNTHAHTLSDRTYPATSSRAPQQPTTSDNTGRGA